MPIRRCLARNSAKRSGDVTNSPFAREVVSTTLNSLAAPFGVALLSLVFVGPKSLWGLVGVVPLLTGLVGNCPLYTLLGINTCPHKSR